MTRPTTWPAAARARILRQCADIVRARYPEPPPEVYAALGLRPPHRRTRRAA